MRLSGLTLTAAGLAGLAVTSTGCILTHDDGTLPAGALSLAWTVESSTSPAACDDANADTLAVDIYDMAGNRVTTEHAPCEDFVMTIVLDPGSYSLDLTLVDANDQAVTTTLSIDTTVRYDAETDIDIDFPSTSFL